MGWLWPAASGRGRGWGRQLGARDMLCTRGVPARGVPLAKEEPGRDRCGAGGRKVRAGRGTAGVSGGGAIASSAVEQQQVGPGGVTPGESVVGGREAAAEGILLLSAEGREQRTSRVWERGGEGGGDLRPAASGNYRGEVDGCSPHGQIKRQCQSQSPLQSDAGGGGGVTWLTKAVSSRAGGAAQTR